MANNIIGDSFDFYVKDQIVTRQQALGLGINPQDVVMYKNNNSAFVRLTSGVNVSDDVIKNLNLTGVSSGNDLAKKFKLYSARAQSGSQEIFTKGIGYNNYSSYGFSSNSDYGYVPPPGIVSAEIKALNRGSLREANIEIQCHNLQQFQILEILYMRLKYSILLEWGHNMYYSNPTRGEDLGITQQPTLQQSRFDLSDEMLSGVESQESMLKLISGERTKSCGNYDAFFGLITNFSWTLRPDGGYNITVTARSMGDVIESLKINTSYPIQSEPNHPELSGSSNTALQTDYYKSSLNRILSSIVYKLGTTNYAHGIDQENGEYMPVHNYKLAEYTGLTPAYNRTSEPDTKKELNQDFLTYQEVLKITFANLSGGVYGKDHYFIKLGTLLRIIESFLVYYDTSKGGKTTRPPVFKIDYNFNTNYCLTFPRHTSLNPKVCLIPVSKESANPNAGFTETTSTYTYVVEDYTKSKPTYPNVAGKEMYGDPLKWRNDTPNIGSPASIPNIPSSIKVVINNDYYVQKLDEIWNTPQDGNERDIGYRIINDINAALNSNSGNYSQWVTPVSGKRYITAAVNGRTDERFYRVDRYGNQVDTNRDNDQYEDDDVETVTKTSLVVVTYRDLGTNYDAGIPTGGGLEPVYEKILSDNPFRAGGFKGKMMHMMVNMEYITSTLTNYINVETGELALYDFLDNLMKGIQHALGNVNNFEIVYDEENNIYRIIDSTTIPGIADSSKDIASFNANLLQVPNNGDNLKIGGSFVKNVNFRTKLSNNFATMTTIGAQANGNAVGANATMLSKWNTGLTDRVITNRENPNYDSAASNMAISSSFIKNVTSLIDLNTLINTHNVGDYEVSSLEGSVNDLFQAELGQFIKRNELPGIGFIPFDLELTMLGLSGPRIYEAYTIDTTLLPKSYQDKIQFICTGVSHRIADGEWTTTLNSIAGPKPLKGGETFNPPPVKVLDDNSGANNNGGDCTPNAPIVDQSTATGTPYPNRNVATIAGVKLNNITARNQKFIHSEYLPELANISGLTKGLKVLITAQAIHEGYYDDTKARRLHNPGNIGNTDDGDTKDWGTLAAGIQAQVDYVKDVANGTKFPFGPIKRSNKYTGGRCVPGFDINFQGELGYYLWIYATGPRESNNYLNDLIGFFKYNGIDITYQTKIQDIIAIN